MSKMLICILLISSLVYTRTYSCKGLGFKEDPFNKDRKEFTTTLSSDNGNIAGINFKVIFDDYSASFILELFEPYTNEKTQKVPKGTPLRIALKNNEQILITSSYDTFAEEISSAFGKYLCWKVSFDITRDILKIVGSSTITGIQINSNNITTTMLPQSDWITTLFSKACNCMNSDDFWEDPLAELLEEEELEKKKEANKKQSRKKRKRNKSDI